MRETAALKIFNKPHHLIIAQQITNGYLMFCAVTTFSDAKGKSKWADSKYELHLIFFPLSAECLKIQMVFF